MLSDHSRGGTFGQRGFADAMAGIPALLGLILLLAGSLQGYDLLFGVQDGSALVKLVTELFTEF